MKITSQSTNELVISESNAPGIAIGVIFIIGGAILGYYLRSSNPATAWIALAMIIIGFAVIFIGSSITIDANKTSDQLSCQKKRLIGGSTAAYAIADILRIETRKQWRMENTAAPGNRGASMPRQVLISQSVIVFKNGQELPIDHQKSSSTSIGPAVIMEGQGTEIAIANQLANFLGVPFQEIAPPSMGGINIGGPGGIRL